MTVYRRPPARVMLEMAPRLASWDRVGAPGQLALAKFLDYADGVAAPLLVGDGPFALELSVAADGWAAPDRGGRDLDNYLFPLVNRLGPQRFAAVFGRKTQGGSWLAAGPALCAPTPVPSLFAVSTTTSTPYSAPM
ncbi:hypothetical protein [Phytohabitans houttuyneae]|uniref:Uncharacterized protein n=1 Tax=Phytohabitans houttuyneae TaxID=1076126 RepID=A0A6V8KMG9_9ACTN|nr:hypothetical protein [Phytohabitans houttuyneae]GFJ85054.1 hypothetical protein Phou_092340 [Phytohabitans houttuyneae]